MRMERTYCRFALSFFAFLSATLEAIPADAASPQQKLERDSSQPMLFIDSRLIQSDDGVSLSVCEAVKHPENPIIRPGMGYPDEESCQFNGSMCFLDGKFRIWYRSEPGGTAYAESEDGIHWTCPRLGLVKRNGSKDNNLIILQSNASNAVFYDPEDPNPERRFKMGLGKPNPAQGGRQSLWSYAFSRDGLRWNVENRPPPDKWKDAEGQNLMRIGDRWAIYTQGILPKGRAVMAFVGDSFDQPPWEWERNVVWTLNDKYPHLQAHGGLAIWQRPGVFLSICGIFQNRNELQDMTTDLELLLSEDGLNWREPWPLATILRRGKIGEWDSKFLVQGGGCKSFVNIKDKTYFYYSGNNVGNLHGNMGIGLATLRRDGFGYLSIKIGWTFAQSGIRKGAITTVPVLLKDKRSDKILLNVENLDLQKGRFIKVELLDKQCAQIPGYSIDDADPISSDGIAIAATWHGKDSLVNLNTDTIRLRIHLQGMIQHPGPFKGLCDASPHLYAIYFHTPPEIEQ